MRAVLKWIDLASRLAGALSVGLVVLIVVLILSEVVCRTLFNLSLSFAWEYSAYSLGAAIFCGAAFTLRTGGHVRVAFLTTSERPLVARSVEFFSTAFGVVVTFYLAFALTRFAWRAFETGSTSPTIDATPLAIPMSGLAIGAILLALQMLSRFIRLIIKVPPEDEVAMRSYSVE